MGISRLGAVFVAVSIACNPGGKDTKEVVDTADVVAPTTDLGVDTATTETGETRDPYGEVPQNPASGEISTGPSANFASQLRAVIDDAELSGIKFDQETRVFYVVNDNGGVAQIGEYGQFIGYGEVLGDLEGITVDDKGSVWVLNESTPEGSDIPEKSILAFNPEDGSYEVAGVLEDIPGEGNTNVEALTWVPAHIASYYWGISDPNGVFIVGSQQADEDGVPRLYVYAVSDLQDGATVTSRTTLEIDAPVTAEGVVDVTGLDFNYRGNETDPSNIGIASLFVLLDDPDETKQGRVLVYSLDGRKHYEFTLPVISGAGDQEEGFTVYDPECGASYEDFGTAVYKFAIAEDQEGGIFQWTVVPGTCQPEDLIVSG